MRGDSAFMALVRAIAAGDAAAAEELLAASPELAGARAEHGATRQSAAEYFLADIGHHLYAGDTALHVAAAGHRPDLARSLIGRGADVAARNRRGAQPLHYAADGRSAADAQAATIACLLAAGADPNARDTSGVAPLHRAVRTRSAAAVAALLAGGADPELPNGNGSTPAMLATRTTGASGSGSPAAKAQQADIVRLLEPVTG
jgi:Ankyrin repeats (many copies)